MSVLGNVARAMIVGSAAMLLAGPAMAQQQVIVIISTPNYAPAYMAPAARDVGIRRYASHENYCPAGLQPVTIDGSISCGAPNRYQSYQQAMRHPVQHVRQNKARHYSARPNCPVGAKGC